MKRILLFLITLMMVLSLVGCSPNRFISPRTRCLALRVVAIHSLLGTTGPNYWEPVIILEEDDFGRILFTFQGRAIMSEDGFGVSFNLLAVLIVQRIPGSFRHAYFYDGVNFIVHQVAPGDRSPPVLTEATARERFTEEQLEQLKEENDWNRELNEDRFFRVPVSWGDKGRYMTRVSEETRREAFSAVSEGFLRSLNAPLSMDRNGNIIYFIRDASVDRDTQEWTFYSSFLFMFDRDGNLIEGTGVKELTDLWDYREELLEFKRANGWSFSYRDVG